MRFLKTRRAVVRYRTGFAAWLSDHEQRRHTLCLWQALAQPLWGTLAAERLVLPFVDGDIEFETVTKSVIDTLLERYGEKEFDERLLNCFTEQLNRPICEGWVRHRPH